ncbi:MAG: type II secretion system protein [Alphaproteobacteria bacterium]|nr:type II secretion system protein [Alphaproteobacteria bacterium]
MLKINQTGRSMIEMLGVLAIIGVLTVGSFGIVGKARQQYQISQALSETSNLIASARKMSCDYESAYGSYTNMLYQSREYPDGVVPEVSDGKAESFTITSDIKLKIEAGDDNTFIATLSNIPEDACVALASADWGNRRFNGYIGATVGGKSSNKDNIMDPSDAADGCDATSGKEPELVLTYSACVRGGE